jgi:virulence-associated protein VagC
MTMQRHVKLTRSAGDNTNSLPAEFALSSDDVVIGKEGDRLIIEPEIARNRRINGALLAWLATQEPLPAEDAMEPVSREAHQVFWRQDDGCVPCIECATIGSGAAS